MDNTYVKHSEERLIAFIDILGFKEHVKNYKDFPEKILQILYDLNSFSSDYKYEKIGALQLDIINYSDNIIISVPWARAKLHSSHSEYIPGNWLFLKLIMTIALLYKCTLSQGIALRGAIAFGNVCINKDKNIITGMPMIEAIEDEKRSAIYPRVIISKSLLQLLNSYEPADAYVSYFQLLRVDFDGVYFIDYLTEIFSPHTGEKDFDFKSIEKIKENIQNNIGNEEIQIAAKWKWLATYFDVSLNNCHYINLPQAKDLPNRIETFDLQRYNLENRSASFKKHGIPHKNGFIKT